MINLPTDFVPGYRYYNVYGTKSVDAKFEVYVDDKLMDNPFVDIEQFDPYYPDLGPVQYSFSTENSFFGAIPVKINMLQGSITLTRVRAFYPAKITNNENSNSFGYYGMFQPIGDPKWMVKINDQLQTLEERDQHLIGEVHHSITAGDVMEYLHGMVDGPNYWLVNYKTSTPNRILDQQDPNINFACFDNFDRIAILKNQLMADYNSSHS